ncbi:hypothetical protein [Corynebacterium poyangense]|nr:hypothetical protein [Corynebacterium poyangense]
MDSIGQFLVDLPLWLQAPLVVLSALAVCAGVGVGLLRIIDFFFVRRKH